MTLIHKTFNRLIFLGKSRKETQHEKLTEGVIGQKIKLVAETDNLDNETEIIFKLFEKEKLLVEKDTALQVVQGDKEVTEITAKVKDGYAVAEVELSKFDSTTYKDWDSKLDPDNGEEKTSEIYIKVREKNSNLVNKFLVDYNFGLKSSTIKCFINANGTIKRNGINFPKKIKYFYVKNNNEYFLGKSKLTEVDKWLVKGRKIEPKEKAILADARDLKSFSSGDIKFKFLKWNSNSNRWWINIDCFAGLLGAMIEESIEDLCF